MGQPVDVAALTRWIGEFARAVAANKDLLTQLDAAIGDADHGINMDRGMRAVTAKLDGTQLDGARLDGATLDDADLAGQNRPASVAALLKQVGMTLVSTVGGTSGPLYGTFFLRMASAAGEVPSLDGPAFARAMRAGLAGLIQRGKAETGDKTMVDALAPAVTALEGALAGGVGLGAALRTATASAEAGRDATTPMRARKGRASYLGERSVGHQDPGATSAALLVAAAATALADVEG